MKEFGYMHATVLYCTVLLQAGRDRTVLYSIVIIESIIFGGNSQRYTVSSTTRPWHGGNGCHTVQ